MQPAPKAPRTPATGHDTYRTGARRSPKPSAQCENGPWHQTQYPRFHELAHALVRHDRRSDDPALDYAGDELVAESVAYTCVGALGVSTEDYSIPYLAAWAESSDLEVLERTAGLIVGSPAGSRAPPSTTSRSASTRTRRPRTKRRWPHDHRADRPWAVGTAQSARRAVRNGRPLHGRDAV